MKFEIRTSVVNGNLKRNKNLVIDAINHYEGKEIVLTIDRAKKKRSNPQNAYYWGLLIPITMAAIKDEWGEVWTKEVTHDFYKMKFLFTERVNEDTGEVLRIPKSTTENTTTAQEDYHAEIRIFLKEWFNVDCPLPNEDLKLEI